MIVHSYVNASDNLAQYMADQIGRQEVTVDWYLDNMIDEPVFRWTSDEDHRLGLDAWRFYADLPLDPEEVKARGWRLFVQRKDYAKSMTPANLSAAAPALYAALRFALEMLETDERDLEPDEYAACMGDAVRQARAAIKQANGQ